MQNFEANEAMVHFLDLEDAARLCDRAMTLWHNYLDALPLQVHRLRYESLIEDFEETLTPLLDFLDVGWDDGIRNYTETTSRRYRIDTPSYYRVTQPLDTRARGRWEQYSIAEYSGLAWSRRPALWCDTASSSLAPMPCPRDRNGWPRPVLAAFLANFFW